MLPSSSKNKPETVRSSKTPNVREHLILATKYTFLQNQQASQPCGAKKHVKTKCRVISLGIRGEASPKQLPEHEASVHYFTDNRTIYSVAVTTFVAGNLSVVAVGLTSIFCFWRRSDQRCSVFLKRYTIHFPCFALPLCGRAEPIPNSRSLCGLPAKQPYSLNSHFIHLCYRRLQTAI